MPTIQIFTNVSKDKIPGGFVLQLSQVWEDLVGKPKKFICVHVVPDQMMSFGGSEDPCASVNLISIGKIGRDENLRYTEKLTEVMQTIGIQKDRMYLTFTNIAGENVGFEGTTFAFWKPS